MENIKPRVRFTKIAAACMALLILAGASSGLTYAATGGETANPIKGIKIYLDGEELGTFDYKKNDDGSFTIHLDKDDNTNSFDLVDDENGSAFTIQNYDGTNLDGEVTYNPNDGKMTYIDDSLRIDSYSEKEPGDDSYDTYTVETDPLGESSVE